MIFAAKPFRIMWFLLLWYL